jgi:2-polyprenyl-3-methyl-5-hydroxy-6-metoxy-1,4-benzoquinol methylase
VDSAHLKEEIDFANSAYLPMLGDSTINAEIFGSYERPSQMWDWRQRAAVALGRLEGKRLLDYGCGQGEESCYFARLGALVTAIDVSDVGIRVGQQRAHGNGLSIDFRVMDCLHTSFSDESFDVVHGLGILHHVGLDSGLREVYRLLVPGGVAVFMEPLQSPGHVERAKAWLAEKLPSSFNLTPVTPDEENLRQADILAASQGWRSIEIFLFRLTYRVRKLLLPRSLWNWSLRFDAMLLRTVPFLRPYAGAAVIVLRK